MAKTYWKTGSVSPKRGHIQWPSGGQIIRQVAIATVVALVWAGLLVGCVSQVGPGGLVQSAPVVEPETAAAEVDPTDTPTPDPTDTSTPLPPNTPTVTNTPLPTLTSATNPDETAAPGEIADTPTPELSPTDTPSPNPTETPVPTPTDTPAPPAPAANAGVSFANDVFPIIERRCIKCHGGPKDDGTLRIEEGLDMRTHAAILAGSWNGPAIEPGNAEASYLVEQIISGEMPKKEPRLLPGEVRTITEWINAGAPDN